MRVEDEIELVKKNRGRQVYIPRERAGEWVKMRRALGAGYATGSGLGCKIMDMWQELKGLKANG